MSKRSKSGWQKPDPQLHIVQMENLTSEEVYLYADGTQRPVLKANTLDVDRGQSWGIVGKEAFAIELLLEIVGCVRPYGSGRCKLVERGMMRKKRVILPHVFFVGDSGMAVPNMSALEYLMFATRYVPIPARDRQIAFLRMMLQSECYEWCFAPIKLLSSQERAVLSLLAASFSDALLIIFPYFHTDTPRPLRSMIACIARSIEQKRVALLMGTCDPTLVQDVCSHSAFMLDGTLQRKGTLDEVTQALDRRDFIVTTTEPDRLCEQLKQKLPDFELRVRAPEYVDVYHRERAALTQREMLTVLADVDAPMSTLRKSERTLLNAFSEASHDLSD